MLDSRTPRFDPILQFEEFWSINLTLEPSTIIFKVLEVVTGDFELPFLYNIDMVNFLTLLKEVLSSLECVLF